MRLSHEEVARRAARLRWLLLDVDGVLTDGRLIYGPSGEAWKPFHVRDGLGLKMARRGGLSVGLLTARADAAVKARARDLKLDVLIDGRSDKGVALDEFLAEHGVREEEVAFVGDDLPDLPVLRRCGLAFAPQDAAGPVKEAAQIILAHRGGEGCARELVELLLRARGQLDEILGEY